jgi:ADP-ribose pyrophosphatase YjhB (NUDIX family)/HD superfamily phosphodiesterase
MLKIVNLCVTDENKNKFLFIKRNKPPFAGYFGMMGGKVKNEEDISVAASRELMEESGISSKGEFLGKCNEKIIEQDNIIGEFEIYFYHFNIPENINFNSSHEGEVKWISREEFEKVKLIPSDPLMIDCFFKNQSKEVNSIIIKDGDEYIQERFEEIKNENTIVEEIRRYVEEECKKPTSKYGYEPYFAHFIPVYKNAKLLAEKENADLEIVELAALLHDVGSIIYGRENHHITSSEIAEKKLKELNYPVDKIEKVKHCILAHRGSHDISRDTIEAQIIVDADAMSHFDNIGGPLKAAMVYEGLGQLEASKSVKEKLERSYNKLSKDAKEIIKPKYEAAMLLLSQDNNFKKNENKKVGVGVGVILLRDGKVLLGKRHEDNSISKSVLGGEGSWTFPGGKLEYGESFEDAGIRETLEECGIKINNINVMCVNNDKNEKAHFITVGLFCDDYSGVEKVMEPSKIVEWKWFSLNDLPEKLYFPTEKMIENYKNNKFYLGGK